MNTTLLVQIAGNTWERLDLFEDISILVTIQQADLLELNIRRAPYSRTFEIPDTSNNAILFEHYFEVNGIDFNPLLKIPCVVQYRGTDIFTGVLRLNAVIESNQSRVYEVFILGEVSEWAANFKDLELQDLDWYDLVHELSYSSVTTSWECVNDGASGLFNGQVLYPMINYGLRYSGETSGATPNFTMDFGQSRSFDQPGYAMAPTDFKPAIQLRSVVDRIFAKSPEYQIQSTFFDSEYFTSIYMDTFQNSEVGVLFVSAVTPNQNIFLAQATQLDYDYNRTLLSPGYKDPYPLPLQTTIGGGYDPLNNYTNGGLPFFRAPYAGAYSFNVKFNLNAHDPLFLLPIQAAKLGVNAYTSTAGYPQFIGANLAYASPDILLSQAVTQQLPVNLFFTINLQAGEYLALGLEQRTQYIPVGFGTGVGQFSLYPFFQGGVGNGYIQFDLYNSPIITSPLLDMKLGMPNINCLDFLKSLITLFNLIIVQDENEKIITIEPYNWYYNDPDRTLQDWTKLLDQDSPKRIEPISYDLSKEIVWSYDFTDFEYLPKLFRDRFDFEFGRYKYTTPGEIFADTQEYILPFGSCPTSGVTGNPNFIIPQYFYLNNGLQAPYATKPHLFFWTGNRFVDRFGTSNPILPANNLTWYLLSGGTAVEWTTYPCVSHLSTLESQYSPIISDLNFGTTFDFFGNSDTYIEQFTNFNVYNSFWKTYVDNLYSPETRRLTGRFFFKPINVYETSLQDKIWIKDAYYTIEKMTDANLVNKTLTEISLIKEQTPYYKIDPPAPIYAITPNQPYPGVEPTFISGCFVGTDPDEVCLGTANIENVLSFGFGTLVNLDRVYYDSGTAWVLYPMGTFIRQTTSSTTFVVVDIYGKILEYDC
jgi:hypothetical protein